MPNLRLLWAGAVVVTLGATYVAGYYQGGKAVQAKWDAAVAEDTKQDHAVLLVGMKDSFDTGLQHEQAREEIRYVTERIVEKIPVYIKADDPVCPVLPSGFGSLHRESAKAVNDALALRKSDGAGAAAAPDARAPNAPRGDGG